MKRSIYLFALLGLLFVLPACQKEVVVEDQGLVSPSGLKLADDYDQLADMIELGYKGKFGMTLETQVKDVNWRKIKGVETGFVEYLNNSGNVVALAVQPRSQVEAKEGKKGKDLENARIDIVVSCIDESCNGCNMTIIFGEEWITFICWCWDNGDCGIEAVIGIN